MPKERAEARVRVTLPIKKDKAMPFGAHFTTKLEGVNSKLVCALSATDPISDASTCTDDPVYPPLPFE